MLSRHLAPALTVFAAFLVPLSAAGATSVPTEDPLLAKTTWINPHGTVKVETAPCNGKLCGWVVWATPEAMQDARDSGVHTLIGTELLQDYRQVAAGRWQGRVYVPDMGRTFDSTITRPEPDRIKISGCVLGGMFCKSQVWRRA